MPVEVELKARVDNPEEIKNKILKFGPQSYTFEKEDVYWAFPNDTSARLRVRRERKINTRGKIKTTTLVTCKIKQIHEGIEINDEKELSVSSGEVFEEILTYLGMEPGIRKKKTGTAWKCRLKNGFPAILAELSDVQHLGYFIELEILTDSRDEQTLAKNRKLLLDLLEKLDIPQNKLESRPYSELLMEKR